MDGLRQKIKDSSIRTQEMLSVVTGINESIISKYCRGIKTPSEEHRRKIAAALGIVSSAVAPREGGA